MLHMKLLRNIVAPIVMGMVHSLSVYGQNPQPPVRFAISTDADLKVKIDSNKLNPMFRYRSNAAHKNAVYKAIVIISDTLSADSIIIKIGTNGSHDNLVKRSFPVASVKGIVHRNANSIKIRLGQMSLPNSFVAVAMVKDHQGNLSAPKKFIK